MVPFIESMQYLVAGKTIFSGIFYLNSKDVVKIIKKPKRYP
jgi:hypothetical protein